MLDLALDLIPAQQAGDIAEIGVYRGHLFKRLCRTGYHCHAFDSFQGMDTPLAVDGHEYPRGALSVGGVDAFQSILDADGIERSAYTLHAGYIPECFKGFDTPLLFCYIDVDHYQPTKSAILFAWRHLVTGGVLGFDDYFPNRGELASRAIDEFLTEQQPHIQIDTGNRQIFFRKT